MNHFQAIEEGKQDLAPDEWEAAVLTHHQFDDRRSIWRAFAAWTDMRHGRLCPSIEDLEPLGVAGPRDVLIDLRSDPDDPELTCIGGALVAESGARGLTRLSQAPAASLLALFAAHCCYVASTRRPVAFEGERESAGGRAGAYRAILLPLSSDGENVDFVHGRISWRDPATDTLCETIRQELEQSCPTGTPIGRASPWPGTLAAGISAVG